MTPTNIVDLGFKTVSEVRTAALSFAPKLPSGVLLTGTPTIVELTTTALTLANKTTNAAALTIDGDTVAIGQAVTWKITGGVAGTVYLMQISCGTNASVAETLFAVARITVIADSE